MELVLQEMCTTQKVYVLRLTPCKGGGREPHIVELVLEDDGCIAINGEKGKIRSR